MTFRPLARSRATSLRPIFHGVGCCLAGLLCLLPSLARSMEYRLQPGDTVEISISGPPELLRRVAVQLDGSLPIPLAGRIAAAGATLPEVEDRIQMALASKPLRTYAPDGRELLRFVEREQISVAVAEYRPVAVIGDVARPGEFPFRPRMTVRHLLASAGGFGRAEGAQAGEAARLRGEYATVWVDLAAQQARVWRLRAELGEEVAFDRAALPPPPVPDRILEQLLAREIEYRTTRASDQERERNYLRNSLVDAGQQIGALTAQNAKEEEGLKADNEELERTVELRVRGMVTQSRVIDARRVVLYSSTRALQTAAQLGAVRRQRGELQRNLERLDDAFRVRLLADLQEELPKLSSSRARLASLEERLAQAGVPIPTSGSEEPRIMVVRAGGQGTVMVAAELDTELQPGDVVDIGRGGGAALAVIPPATVAARTPQ